MHSWLLEQRDLVERELFFEPPEPALSVAPTDQPPKGGPPSPATASALVAACETAWADIQSHHPELPDAVIVLGTGVERGRLVKLGHWWGGRWIADGQVRGEVLIAGEALHLEPKQVFEILLHEAGHGINAARGVKDTSRGGRYHNQRYADTAREVLLRVRPMSPYGMADTRLSDAALDRYEGTIAQLGDTMRIVRQLERTKALGTEQELGSEGNGSNGRRSSGSNAVATCPCGRRMRMAPSVLSAGPVTCGLCGQEFVATPERLHKPEAERASAVVDETFVARRRAALAADEQAAPHTLDGDALARQRDRLAAAIAAHVGDRSLVQPLTNRHERLRVLTGPSTTYAEASATQLDGLRALSTMRSTQEDVVELASWYERFGTLDERPMAASTTADRMRRDRLARALLKADGSLRGPTVATGQLELMLGDRVTSTTNAGDYPPDGTPGTVVEVDPTSGTVGIDFATWGRLRGSLAKRLEGAIRYDYTEPRPSRSVDPRLELERVVPEMEP